MRIEYENAGRINFSLMDNGDCFMVDGQLYMRIPSVTYIDRLGISEEKNVVLLENGTLGNFEDWEKVLPAEAKVVVEWKN